jgi:hypothetical protein
MLGKRKTIDEISQLLDIPVQKIRRVLGDSSNGKKGR